MTGKARKLMSEQRGVAMVNHCAVLHVLRLVSLLSLIIFKQVSKKNLLSVFLPAILGPEMASPILWGKGHQ